MPQPLLGIEIVGYGASLPLESIGNDELIARHGLDSSDEWIRERTGISERYIADPERGETNASLAAAAGSAALAMAEMPAGEVDSLILATITPDRPVPATSARVQRLLGLENASAMDINAACSGFVYALNDGYRHVATGEERSLVIGADLLSRITDWQDRRTAILFGDGAGAVVLQKTDRENEYGEKPGLLGWYERADGSLEEMLYCDHGGYLYMEGQNVYKHAVRLVTGAAKAALEAADVKPDDLSLIVPHQANKRIIDSAARHLGMDTDKMIWTGDRHANTSSASVPLALAESLDQERLRRNDLCLLIGFGAGMTVAASVIRY